MFSGESLFDVLGQGRDREAQAAKIYGLMIGKVSNNKDPEKWGRVKVTFPELSDEVESYWCWLSYPMAGKQMGFWWVPEVDDIVLVAFLHGDRHQGYILGAVHHGKTGGKPNSPQTNDITGSWAEPRGYDHGPYSTGEKDFNSNGRNDLRYIRSRSGHLFMLDDTPGSEKITLASKTGAHRLQIDVSQKKVMITSGDGDIELVAQENVLIRCKNLITETWEDTNMKAERDVIVHADQNMKQDAGKNVEHRAGENMEVTAAKNMLVKAGPNLKIQGQLVEIN